MVPQFPVFGAPPAPTPQVALPVLINGNRAHSGSPGPRRKTPASPCAAVRGGIGYPPPLPLVGAIPVAPGRDPSPMRVQTPMRIVASAEMGRASPIRGMPYAPPSPGAMSPGLQVRQISKPRAAPVSQAVPCHTPQSSCRPHTTEPLQILEGMQVDYWSESNRCWLPAMVVEVHAETGDFKVDVKAGVWISMQASNGSPPVRPRTRPTQAQLQHMRDLLHDGQLLSEADALFHRHAVVEGTEEAGIGIASVLDLSREVDALLGVVGSIQWIRQRLKETTNFRLLKDDFTAVLCKHLWKVYGEYANSFSTPRATACKAGDISQTYNLGKPLGQGTFGDVFLAHRHDSMAWFAVKRVKKNVPSEVVQELEQEMRNLSTLDHPHIIKLYEYYSSPDYFFLVTDFCPGGDLKDVVEKTAQLGTYLKEDYILEVMHQVLSAIAHVHGRGLMHLDLKPANVMLMPSCSTLAPSCGRHEGAAALSGGKPHAMVIDFGVACFFDTGGTYGAPPRGTPLTMAPEVWQGKLTPKADVFSLGVMLFNLLSNSWPFAVPVDQKKALNFWGYTGSPKPHAPWELLEHSSPAARGLCQSMIVLKRHRRPATSDCMKMDFFAGYDHAASATAYPGVGVQHSPLVVAFTPKILQQLVATRLRTPLQKSVSLLIARQWPSNTLPSIKRAFEALDGSRSGRLSKAHVERSLNELGVDPYLSPEIVLGMDLNSDGMIDWTEFVAACIEPGDDKLNADLEEVFKLADKDCDGWVSAKDLASLLQAEHLRGGEALHDALAGLINSKMAEARVDLAMFREYFRSERSKAVPTRPPSSPRGRSAAPTSPRTPKNPRKMKRSGSWFDGLARQFNIKAQQLAETGRLTFAQQDPSRGRPVLRRAHSDPSEQRGRSVSRPELAEHCTRRSVSPIQSVREACENQWQNFLGWIDEVLKGEPASDDY